MRLRVLDSLGLIGLDLLYSVCLSMIDVMVVKRSLSCFFLYPLQHANNVRNAAEDYLARRQARQKSMTKSMTTGIAGPILSMGNVHFLPAAKSGTFFARDNVSNFITWCRWVLHTQCCSADYLVCKHPRTITSSRNIVL